MPPQLVLTVHVCYFCFGYLNLGSLTVADCGNRSLFGLRSKAGAFSVITAILALTASEQAQGNTCAPPAPVVGNQGVNACVPDDGPAPYCSTQVDNAHISTNANGIVVKSRTRCFNETPNVLITLTLFLCPDGPPVGDETTWQDQGCQTEGSGWRSARDPAPTFEIVVVAPGVDSPAPQGTGWWVGCARTTIFEDGGQIIWDRYSTGTPVYLSY